MQVANRPFPKVVLVLLTSAEEMLFTDLHGLSNAITRFVEVVNALLEKLDVLVTVLRALVSFLKCIAMELKEQLQCNS